MDTPVIENLLKQGLEHFRIRHSPQMAEELCAYMRELERWNTRVNLTARKPLAWVVQKLLYDAFFLCSMISEARSVLDMGSGSGILAVAIAILKRDMRIISVDKMLRKIQFQKHVKRTLKLENLSLIHGRIESLEPLSVDALVSKGFGSSKIILRHGGKHLKARGLAYLLKGPNEQAGSYPDFALDRVTQYRLPGNERNYQLFVYRKTNGPETCS